MSRAQRAELERVQSEVARVRNAIAGLGVQISQASKLAQTAEAQLAEIHAPLQPLLAENRTLERQIRCETNWACLWQAEESLISALGFLVMGVTALLLVVLLPATIFFSIANWLKWAPSWL